MKKEEYLTLLNKIKTRSQEPQIKKINKYVENVKKEFATMYKLDEEYGVVLDKIYDKQFHKWGLVDGKKGYYDTRPQDEYNQLLESQKQLEDELKKVGFYKSIGVEKNILCDCMLKASYNYMNYILQDLVNDGENNTNKIVEFAEYDASKRGENWLYKHFIRLHCDYSKTLKCSYYLNGWEYLERYYWYVGDNMKVDYLKYELKTLKQVSSLLKKSKKKMQK